MNSEVRPWLIIFGEDWGKHPSTGQFLAMELANEYRILWINSLGMRSPGLNLYDIKRIFIKLYEFIAGQLKTDTREEAGRSSAETRIYVFAPIAIPWIKYRIIRRLNGKIIGMFLRRKMRELGISESVVIAACPSAGQVVGDLKARAKIYYCADEHSAFPGVDRELVGELEKDLMRSSDLVVVTAKLLADKKKDMHKNIQYLPHGVDYDLFSKACAISSRPAELLDISNPIIGFVGQIGEHIDTELLSYCATSLPNFEFVMIGPVQDGVVPPKQKNIRYVGAKKKEDLPAYLAHFAVCIVPYLHSERTKYANPTKIREYLAAGCPVVSVPQNEAGYIHGDIQFAESKEEFSEEISRLVSSSPMDRKKISESMRNDSWENRAKRLVEMLQQLENGKAGT